VLGNCLIEYIKVGNLFGEANVETNLELGQVHDSECGERISAQGDVA
jgi:hypothetical protein